MQKAKFLNPQEDGYWLLDSSVMPKPAGGGSPTPEPPIPGPTPIPGPQPGPDPTPATKTYRKVTISGKYYPITTSSTIISTKPMAKPMVLRLECSPSLASGISSSTTT